MINFKTRNVYSFDVYPVAVLGMKFSNVTVMAGSVDPETARASGTDIYGLHAQVFPSLPAGSTPDDPTAYDYVKIKMADGEVTCIGLPWIVADSVQLIEEITFNVKISKVSMNDLPLVVQALAANGYTAVDITVV